VAEDRTEIRFDFTDQQKYRLTPFLTVLLRGATGVKLRSGKALEYLGLCFRFPSLAPTEITLTLLVSVQPHSCGYHRLRVNESQALQAGPNVLEFAHDTANSH
jgi:hypothetical protein